MNIETFLFAITSFASVLLYYITASEAKWVANGVKSFEDAYWNAFQTFLFSLAIIVFRNGPPVTIWAVIPILPTALIYGLISQQPGMDFDLTGNNPLTPTQIGVLSAVGILVLIYVAIVLYRQDYTNPVAVLWKFAPLFLFIIWLLTWLGVNKDSTTSISKEIYQPGYQPPGNQPYQQGGITTNTFTTQYSLHIHHWIIAVIGFLLSKDHSTYSQIVSGIFWGVFCQEAGAYGIALPSDSRVTTTSSFQQNKPTLGPGGTQTGLGPGGTHYM